MYRKTTPKPQSSNLLFKIFASVLYLFLALCFFGSKAQAQSQTFNASGTFNVPAGVTQVTVEAWGGGGRGATRTIIQNAGGGGGGGAYARKVLAVTPATPFTVTIGAGSTSTSPGGDSWFGTAATVMAKGGNSGSGTTGGTGGTAVASIGDVKFNGGNGSGSGGGGSSAGSAAIGANGSGGTGATAPTGGGNGGGSLLPGAAPGGGGGSGAFSIAPGNGGTGRVIVTWILPNITSISPTEICAIGDHNVALTGTNFTGATAVKFNGVDALSFTVNSGTSISAVAPNGVTTGTISVTIPSGTGTSAAVLTVKANPVIAPITNGDTTLCAEESVDLDNVTPGGTWSSSNDAVATVDGDGWVTSHSAGVAIISYSITDLGCSSSVTTTITVNDPVNSSSPSSESVVTGSTTVFSVTATGSIASYQWKVSTDGGETYNNLADDSTYSGTATNTLTVTNTPIEFNGYYYQIVITPLNPCPVFESLGALLNVGDTGITAHPVNVTLCSDGSGIAAFDITPVGSVNSYVWMESQGLEMAEINDGTFGGITYSGATTSHLTVSGVGLAQSGWTYQAVVVGPSNSATSNIAFLTVNEMVAVSVPPVGQSVCYSGGSALFTVEVTGAAAGYQWQYSSDGINFANVADGIPAGASYSGQDSTEFTVTTTAATPVGGTYFYRVDITGALPCGSIQSSAAQLHIYTPTIASHPAPALVAAGNSTVFSVSTNEPSPSFQWQSAAVIDGPYTNVANGTPSGITYSGENTATLTVNTASSVATGTRFYRAIVTSAGCSVSSNGAQLSIAAYCAPATSIGNGSDIMTNVVVSNVSQGINITQASSGAAPWYTVYNNTPLNIIQGQNMSVAITFGTDGTQYSAVWIDYNRNGTFETSENVALAASASGASSTVTHAFLIPFTASPGTTRIRIRGASDAAYTAGGACMSVQYGETEDYIINIIEATPCTGNPVVGTVASSTAAICNSGTATLTVSGYATGFTGLSFQWYNADSGLIPGATQTTYTTPPLTATNSYYVRLNCAAGGFSDSNTVTIVYQNPTVVSTTPASRCGAGNITLSAVGSVGSTLKWYAAATGGSPLFTGDNFAILNLAGTTTYYVEANIDSCLSLSRTAVTATIVPGPALTLSAPGTAICAGESTAAISITAGLADYDTFTWEPASGVSGNSTGGYIFAPATSTVYVLSASNAGTGCNATTSFSVAVNPLPAALAIAPTSATICSNGAPLLLTATGGSINNVTIMAENFDNAAPLWSITNGGSSPAATNWAFNAAPFSDAADSATFANFTTVNGGKFAMANSDAGGTFTTTNTVLTSPVFSTVGYSSATLTFEHAFRSFAVDVTVKLQISTNGGSSWSDLVNYLGTSVGNTGNNAQTTAVASVNLNAYLNQPNLRIRYNYVSVSGYYWIIDNVRVAGTDPGKVTWSPTAGLFTNAGGTTPYTGQVAASVYAKPASATTYTATVTAFTTCSVSNQVTINTLTAENWYADSDGDGFGNLAVTYFGCTQPGYVTNSTDCDDTNAAVYQSGTFYVDADGDGYNNGTTQTICYGAVIPFGYAVNDIGLDCNDALAAVNPGHAEVLYNGIDDNCDGQLDEGFQYTTSIMAAQCATTLSTINSFIVCTSIPYVTRHRFEVTNISTNEVQILERYQNYFSPAMLPSYDYATTYSIRVELQRNGVWLGYYGPSCLVSSPAVLDPGGAASISPSQCGGVLPTISTLIATTSLPNVTGYRFRITNTDPLATNAIQTIDRGPFNWFALTMLANFNYGTTYFVEVSIKTNGVFSAFGSPCAVTSPPAPMLTNCGTTIATKGALVSTTSLDRVTAYRFRILNMVTSHVTTIDRSQNWFTFNHVPDFTPGGLYGVQVAVMTNGVFSPFGEGCEITAPASLRTNGKPVFNAVAYPNPFEENFMIQMTTEREENTTIKVYDMMGKLIESRFASLLDMQVLQVGANYPAGVYQVVLAQGENIKTLRVIKR